MRAKNQKAESAIQFQGTPDRSERKGEGEGEKAKLPVLG